MMEILKVSSYGVAVVALGFMLIRYFSRLYPKDKRTKVMVFVAAVLFNPYIYQIFIASLTDSLQQTSLLLFIIAHLINQQPYMYCLIGIASVFNPSNAIIAIQTLITNKNKSRTSSLSFLLLGAISTYYLHYYLRNQSLILNYPSLYFPREFHPQMNSYWIMLSHMFERYISLYQWVFLLLPIASLYLVNHISLASEFKIILLLFIKTYCCYECSELCMVFRIMADVAILAKYLPKLLGGWRQMGKRYQIVKLNILTMVIIVVIITLFTTQKLLLNTYLNHHTINMGYLLVYYSVFWGIQAIYLSEVVSSSVELHQLLAKKRIQSENIRQMSVNKEHQGRGFKLIEQKSQ